MTTPAAGIDTRGMVARVINYYYAGQQPGMRRPAVAGPGLVQYDANFPTVYPQGLPAPAALARMVPAALREWYNFFAGRDWYGGEGEMTQVLCTLDPCQQQRWYNDHAFRYVIDYIDAMNRPLGEDHHEDRFYIYSSSRLGGPANQEAQRPFNPVAWLGTRDNQIRVPTRLIHARNQDHTAFAETVRDGNEYGHMIMKQDLSRQLGYRNF